VSKSCQREKATTQQEQEQANEIVKCNRNQVSEQTEQTDKLTNWQHGRTDTHRGKNPREKAGRKTRVEKPREAAKKCRSRASPFKWRTRGLMLYDIFGAWLTEHCTTLDYTTATLTHATHCATWHLSRCWRSGNLTSLTTKRGNPACPPTKSPASGK